MPLQELDLDPETQKMCQIFAKESMHDFWKKTKSRLKNAGSKEQQAEFKALYKQFNLNLGKVLDKFDEAFPNEKEMKKYVPKLESIFKEYLKLTEESPIDGQAGGTLEAVIELLEKETKRRMAWVKKNVKV